MASKLELEELVTQAASDLMGVTALTACRHRKATGEAGQLLRGGQQLSAPQRPPHRGQRPDRRVAAARGKARSGSAGGRPIRRCRPDVRRVGTPHRCADHPAVRSTTSRSTTPPTRIWSAGLVLEVGVSLAVVPLLGSDDTMGVLGFVKYGDRAWTDAEINALRAVAGLLAQLQARVEAEERLRHQAYHDELTDLANRRSLVDHLDERLQTGQTGPVGLIFVDVDWLKALNSFLRPRGRRSVPADAGRSPARTDRRGPPARPLGGDEFVLVMSKPTTERAAWETAERLRSVANEPIWSAARGQPRGSASGSPWATRVVRVRADEPGGPGDAGGQEPGRTRSACSPPRCAGRTRSGPTSSCTSALSGTGR